MHGALQHKMPGTVDENIELLKSTLMVCCTVRTLFWLQNYSVMCSTVYCTGCPGARHPCSTGHGQPALTDRAGGEADRVVFAKVKSEFLFFSRFHKPITEGPTSQRAGVCNLTQDSLQFFDIVHVCCTQVEAFKGVTGLSMLKGEPLSEGDPIVSNDPLPWWKLHACSFPLLATVDRHVVAIPASSARSVRLFPVAGQTETQKRARLSSDNVGLLILLQTVWPTLDAWAAQEKKRATSYALASCSANSTRRSRVLFGNTVSCLTYQGFLQVHQSNAFVIAVYNFLIFLRPVSLLLIVILSMSAFHCSYVAFCVLFVP